MAEYKIHSPTYGEKTILLDDDIYNMITRCGFNVFIKSTKTKNVFYAVLRTRQINKKRSYYYLHRLIMECPKELTVDHINHNTLDNRRCNLRICTQFQNNQNKLRTKIRPGVRKVNKKFVAYINGKHLGTFNTKEEAIKAREITERSL